MATVKVFDQFWADLIAGVHGAMNSATYKVMLSNETPDKAANAVAADITPITGGSYADGSVTLDWAETPNGTFTLGDASSDVTFTASGSAFTEFRYAYLYNDTPTSPADPLIGVLDYGSGVTVPDGGSFTVNAGATGWVVFTTPSWT